MTGIPFENQPSYLQDYIMDQEYRKLENAKYQNDNVDRILSKTTTWITVAEKCAFHNNGFEDAVFIFSSIVTGKNKASLYNLLENSYWEVNATFGFSKTSVDWEDNYYYESSKQKKGMKFTPFVYFREFPDTSRSSYFELSQDFILFHNAYLNQESGYYQIIVDGEIRNIARLENSNMDKSVKHFWKTCHKISVEQSALMEYICALKLKKKALGLIFYYNIRRQDPNKTARNFVSEIKCCPTKSRYNNANFTIRLKETSSGDFWSELEGKRVLFPISNPRKHYLVREQHVKFIYEQDENSIYKEFSCNPELLSNLFTKKVDIQGNPIPEGLKVIWFKITVLDKYLLEPTLYSVYEKGLAIEGGSGLSFDKSGDFFVCAYLKDLADLPYRQQLHWREYNVPPQGKVPKVMIERDQLLKPPRFAGEIDEFQRKYNRIQEIYEKKYGETLFKLLEEEDKYVKKLLFIPTSNEQRKLDDFLMYLAKLTSDSLNNMIFQNVNKPKNKGTIFHFGEWLKLTINPSAEHISVLVDWLLMIQNLRSTGSGHRKGKNYAKLLKKLGLTNKTPIEISKYVINESVIGLQKLIELTSESV